MPESLVMDPLTNARKNAPATRPRGRPFAAGNPGRPKGARNQITRLVENLVQADAETITRAAIDRAIGGDSVLLRALLDRLAPPCRDRVVEVALPRIGNTADVTPITAALVEAVADGTIAPAEAKAIGDLVDTDLRAVELRDIEQRVQRLEDIRTKG